MAKNTQPIAKRCRALGISPAVMGYGKKTTNRNPGGQMRKKKSEYATQLNEKQKVKFVYGILESQFHTYYEKASRMPGQTGVNLLVLPGQRRLSSRFCQDPPRRSPAGFPQSFHCQWQACQHPLLPG